MPSLLTQNSELRRDGVWNWTLPAWVVELSDGSRVNACPNAGACVSLCYARNGTYLFPKVRAAHVRNLEWTLTDLEGWKAAMLEELSRPRYRPSGEPRLEHLAPVLDLDEWAEAWRHAGGAAVRVHDAGDFYSDDYLLAWLEIARKHPDVLFYAYTKEVSRFRRLEDWAPDNFRWLYSLGGREDHLVDLEQDRHADVFPDLDTLADAGYMDQTESDLLAVLLPTTRVGIPANNIRHLRKRQGAATFGEIEASLTRHSRKARA
jgi:hypothetical protein